MASGNNRSRDVNVITGHAPLVEMLHARIQNHFVPTFWGLCRPISTHADSTRSIVDRQVQHKFSMRISVNLNAMARRDGGRIVVYFCPLFEREKDSLTLFISRELNSNLLVTGPLSGTAVAIRGRNLDTRVSRTRPHTVGNLILYCSRINRPKLYEW